MKCIKITVEEYSEIEKDYYKNCLIKLIEDVKIDEEQSA